ncbi:hypothetical protein B4U79_06974, partial [Dinothrombium tinctorium]
MNSAAADRAEEAIDSSILHYGDIVSLFAHADNYSGFLSSLGLVDDRCVVKPDDGNLDRIPIKYRGTTKNLIYQIESLKKL